eukprot:7210605-Lingulodinium_polyedra.AAC.2
MIPGAYVDVHCLVHLCCTVTRSHRGAYWSDRCSTGVCRCCKAALGGTACNRRRLLNPGVSGSDSTGALHWVVPFALVIVCLALACPVLAPSAVRFSSDRTFCHALCDVARGGLLDVALACAGAVRYACQKCRAGLYCVHCPACGCFHSAEACACRRL